MKYNPHAIKGRWIIQADAVAQQNKKNTEAEAEEEDKNNEETEEKEGHNKGD